MCNVNGDADGVIGKQSMVQASSLINIIIISSSSSRKDTSANTVNHR